MAATPSYRVDDTHTGTFGREARCFGPPGCGKTTWLTGSVTSTAHVRGLNALMVASFTKSAAVEIASRGLPLPKSQMGTLHAIAYGAIDRPPVADEQLDDWNSHHRAYALTVKARGTDLDDGAPIEAGVGGATDGDALLGQLDNLRARLVPPDDWPSTVRAFAEKWEAWKRDEGLVDFGDMIDIAYRDTTHAPGRPEVGFFDEAQDFTPGELRLIRHWGQQMEHTILAGDDDQTIYGFKGASPDAFLNPPIPDSDKIVLSQSYRVPASVHRAAEHWIRQVSHRQEKLYQPREEEGRVRHIGTSYRQPAHLAEHVERALASETFNADGSTRPTTVMVLASCAYMVDPLKHELRARGLPFSNPWRASRGDWNPLASRSGTTSSRERLLAYVSLDERDDVGMGDLSRPWTGEDVRRFAHVLKKQGIFVRGAKDLIEVLPDRELNFHEVAELFADEAHLDRAVTPDLDWFQENLLAASRPGMAFPLKVARQRGPRALVDAPRVHIGTIHSFKGSEADVVFLIPDLSQRGANEWRQRGAPQDGVRRQMYVGMTRARRELVVCGAGTPLHVPPEKLVAGARRAA